MRRLKLLILSNARISGGPVCLPNDLRWLEWYRCHSSTLMFSAGPKKLVCFDVRGSRIKKFGGNLKDFNKLKFITLIQCQSLICMLDISCTPNLEKLCIHNCKNLEHVQSIACHGKLWSLELSQCPHLQSFPDISVKNEALLQVFLSKTGIKEIPASIGNLVSLKHMHLMDNKKLAILPSSIYRLENLEFLELSGCSRLKKFPKEEEEDLSECCSKTGFPMLSRLSLGCCNLSEAEFLDNLSSFPRLRTLEVYGNNFIDLPTCEKLYNLKYLDVSGCQQLQEIPKLPKKLRKLKASSCKSLSRLPSKICDIESVELYSARQLVHNGAVNDYYGAVNDYFKFENFHHQTNCQVILPGREMPKWLIPNKEGYISFVASKDFHKKILGVVFCVVFQGKRESPFSFEVLGVVDSKKRRHTKHVRPFNLDHVWLEYMESKELWMVDHFGPNDLSHFHVCIRLTNFCYRPSCTIVVKKCGFRLICKPLENDSEVLLQDDQLLDPALLYEVSHEDNPTSTKEESSSETEDLRDSEICTKGKGLNMIDFSIQKHRYSSLESRYQNVFPGREMPKKFVLVEDGTISFMASQDLYDKLVGLYLCVVLSAEDGKKEVSFDITPHVNGQRRNELSGTLGPFDMDHVWFQLFTPHKLWGALEGAVDFGQFDESYLRFSLNIRVTGVTVKKLGYVIRSCQLEDALKVEIERNRLIDPASLYEDNWRAWYEGDSLEFWRECLEMGSGRLGTQDASIY